MTHTIRISVKCGIVKCQSACETSRDKTIRYLQGEKTSVIWPCIWWLSFLFRAEGNTKRALTVSAEPPVEFRSTAVLPYIKGFSEQLCCCIKQGMHAVFKSNTTLPSHLVRPKDAVDPAKQDGVVYNIHSACGKVCISETSRLM